MRVARAVLLTILLGSVAAGCLEVPGELATRAGASAEAPAFRLVDSGATGVELTLGVTSGGRVFVGGWNAVMRSRDGGLSWEALSTPDAPRAETSADRVLLVDPATDRVFVLGTTLACTLLQWSDDDGESWEANPLACGSGVMDHAKVAVGRRVLVPDPLAGLYPNLVYVCANGAATNGCVRSADGGRAFLPATPDTTRSCGLAGAPVADARGVLYQPSAACGAQVLRSRDAGLSWTRLDLPADPNPGQADPGLAATPDGTLYYFFVERGAGPALLRSRDGGDTWEGPYRVVAPGLVAGAYASVAAGDDGRIGLAFYGTTDDAPGWDHDPGTAPASVHWHGYVALVTDADADPPTLAAVRVTPEDDPLERGCVTTSGGCRGSLREYMGAAVGPDGRLFAVFVDNCPPGCAPHEPVERVPGVLYVPDGPLAGLVAVQTGGPRLRG